MLIPFPEDGRVEIRAKRTQLFIRRLRVLLWFGLCATLLFATDHRFRSYLIEVYPLMALQAGFCLLALYLLRHRRYQHQVLPIALATEAFACFAAARGAILGRNVGELPEIYVTTNLAAATLLPWGWRPQLFVGVVSSLTTWWAYYFLTGNLNPLAGGSTLVLWLFLIAMLAVVIADRLQRHARDIERLTLEVRGYREMVEETGNLIFSASPSGTLAFVNRAWPAHALLFPQMPPLDDRWRRSGQPKHCCQHLRAKVVGSHPIALRAGEAAIREKI